MGIFGPGYTRIPIALKVLHEHESVKSTVVGFTIFLNK